MMCFQKNRKTSHEKGYSRAKELYYNNFANYGNMERNGEYGEYAAYQVPEALELTWSKAILENCVRKIQAGEDIWLVSTLANIRIDESEIINSFQILAKSPNVREIAAAVERSKPLIPLYLFDRIRKVLSACTAVRDPSPEA